jgi:hypothetical protein
MVAPVYTDAILGIIAACRGELISCRRINLVKLLPEESKSL